MWKVVHSLDPATTLKNILINKTEKRQLHPEYEGNNTGNKN